MLSSILEIAPLLVFCPDPGAVGTNPVSGQVERVGGATIGVSAMETAASGGCMVSQRMMGARGIGGMGSAI
jgi:hypothetical protein